MKHKKRVRRIEDLEGKEKVWLQKLRPICLRCQCLKVSYENENVEDDVKNEEELNAENENEERKNGHDDFNSALKQEFGVIYQSTIRPNARWCDIEGGLYL
jgi:hypothetical protein